MALNICINRPSSAWPFWVDFRHKRILEHFYHIWLSGEKTNVHHHSTGFDLCKSNIISLRGLYGSTTKFGWMIAVNVITMLSGGLSIDLIVKMMTAYHSICPMNNKDGKKREMSSESSFSPIDVYRCDIFSWMIVTRQMFWYQKRSKEI